MALIRLMTMVAIAAIVTLTSVETSAAEQPQILTGSEKGSYYNDFGPRIKAAIAKRRFPHELVASKGTVANHAGVCANPHSIGIGQADVLSTLSVDNCEIVITNVLASECVFGVTSFADLKNVDQAAEISFNLRVAYPAGSGSEATWNNMVHLDPRLADAQPVPVESAAAAVTAVARGQADLAVFVAFPNPENPVFAAANEAGLHFVEMSSWDMLQQQVAGEFVYDDLVVTTKNAGLAFWKGPGTVRTACTKALAFTGSPDSPNLDRGERFQSALIATLKGTPAEELRPDTGWLREIMNTAAATSRDAMNAAAEKARKFADDNKVSR